MGNPIKSKRILLGITGSIACYKAADLASKLSQMGALVDTLLTQSAQQFITPLTMQSVTGRKAYTDADLWGQEGHVLHIGLAYNADLLVIAPATANTLAKMAQGLADNLLSVTALAVRCPLVVAPAMDGGMYSHPATQANLDTLRKRSVTIVGPLEGHLASGQSGVGRMVEPYELLGHIRLVLAREGPLKKRKIVVTAGGTLEPIDPVRVISNRSSGKQGFALAQAALDLGAEVDLIAGPVQLETPVGARRINVNTAEEMLSAVREATRQADALLMAAAVADFKPIQVSEQKIKKESGPPRVELEPTPDILTEIAEQKSISGYPKVTVGFAAESQKLIVNAGVKLTSKKLDLIVANDITREDAGFAAETNLVSLLTAQGDVENLPLMSKYEVAEVVLERVRALLQDKGE